MGQRWSLRARFVLVALACLLPLLGVVLFLLRQNVFHEHDQLLDAQVATAEVVAQVVGTMVEDYDAVLHELAGERALQRLDAEPTEALLTQFRRARPNSLYALFLVADDRTLVATAGLEAGPLPEGVTPALDDALGPTAFGMSTRLDLSGGDEAIAIAVPVMGESKEADGEPVAAVGALLSVERLRETVLPFARGQTEIAIVAYGELIASRAAEEGSARGDLTDRLAEPIAAASAGAIDASPYEDVAGAERVAAYAPIEVPGGEWAVIVTHPSPMSWAVNGPLLMRGVAALALAVVAALALALLLGEWIARPLRQMTEQAVGLTRGDFSRPAPSVRGGEIGALSAAFRAMADRFAIQVADLETARQEGAAWAEQLRELHRRTVRLQEDERRRIASDIHDAVAPLITGALYQARALRLTDGAGGAAGGATADGVAEGLDAVGDLLARAMTELHDVIFSLRPPDLDDIGVVAAIERYAAQIRRSGLNVRLETVGESPALTPEVRLAIYRIVQEALHNALRHAAADEAVVRLEVADGLLRVAIRDNGAGFDPERATRPSALGLLSMRERASAIGAGFAIASRPGDGTTVVIERRLEPEPVAGGGESEGSEVAGVVAPIVPASAPGSEATPLRTFAPSLRPVAAKAGPG